MHAFFVSYGSHVSTVCFQIDTEILHVFNEDVFIVRILLGKRERNDSASIDVTGRRQGKTFKSMVVVTLA